LAQQGQRIQAVLREGAGDWLNHRKGPLINHEV
jgi:hypothetical protein